MVPEFDGISDSDGSGFFVEDSVAAVVLECWSNIKTIVASIIPGATCHGFVVDVYGTSSWSQWCGIKVECSKKVMPCGDSRVASARA